MYKWLLMAAALAVGGAAHADDGTGLGSQITGQIEQQGLSAPASGDFQKVFRGQNGDPVFALYGAVAPYTIATLPACATNVGLLAYVTNGVATPTYRDTVSTTGSTNQLVWCDGTNWTYR